MEKVQRKSAETAISGIFPAFSAKKKCSEILDSAKFWTLLIRVFVQKLKKMSRKCQKNRFFRHISGIFGRKKTCSKIGLPHILGITILHQCAKFHEKTIKCSSRNSKSTSFLAKIGCSGNF